MNAEGFAQDDSLSKDHASIEDRRAIEAVVLAATEPVEARFLAELVELPVARVEELCADLAREYEETQRGFVLTRVAGGYRYQTHPDLAGYVERFVIEGQHVRLSGPSLETLAIVAYKQPI
ncbi:MAG: segregation and condensation protein B, partial [Acidimicrobiia bacterium]|nr:segregation and condensation protein B [Acidimicrobiia bacterium]